VQSILLQAGIGDAEAERLEVDVVVFSQARLVIDRLEQIQREFVGSAARMCKRYEGSREFFASQRQEIEATVTSLVRPFYFIACLCIYDIIIAS
jgi:hypothetical protein